jgi:hypothetical protein
MYEEPNWTAPNRIAFNWTMQSQTKECLTTLSCEICSLLGYNVAQSGNSIPTFQDNLSAPSLKVKKYKSENRATLS